MRALYKKKHEWLLDQKRKPCADCGNNYHPVCMDFDHVRGKKLFPLASMVSNKCTMAAMQTEIKKCDLVCSNCHRLRTFKRKQWSKNNRRIRA